ncbi:HAD-IA family hydrolase [Streptosporangium sp. NBC_01495]|uniref:HAD-IA family hydrolase n=1 Tax=Streptosporangium sp. NBC_01495 TaxID=2903899 RepID=UPI002E2F8962|nr:HAD-IA family hydrolase [Streptosporangium sp. NBC_01495]
MTTWMLLDYGEVISMPQPSDATAAMAELIGQDHATFRDRYWHHREAYDRGQASHSYWSGVAGRTLADDDPLVATLNAADVASWFHLNPETLRAIEDLAGHHGLALLSNAPEPLAAAIDAAPWAAAFTHRFYSCRLTLAKPDPAIFEEVLRHLDAAPGDVTFLDDRAVNVRAAAALGINALLYPDWPPFPRAG